MSETRRQFAAPSQFQFFVTIPCESEQPALTQESSEKKKRNPIWGASADAPAFENQSGGWLAASSVESHHDTHCHELSPALPTVKSPLVDRKKLAKITIASIAVSRTEKRSASAQSAHREWGTRVSSHSLRKVWTLICRRNSIGQCQKGKSAVAGHDDGRRSRVFNTASDLQTQRTRDRHLTSCRIRWDLSFIAHTRE
jgi:hypothetical protein